MFSLITNFLEIRVKLNSMVYYSKRTTSEGASGIGSWLPIMELISMICIPINVATIYWTGYTNRPSVLVQFLKGRDEERIEGGERPVWTNENIILFLILMEHVILALKILLAVLIPDVPQKVLFEEYRQEKIATMAKKEIQVYKILTHSENYDEGITRLEKVAMEEGKNTTGPTGRKKKRGEKQ